MSYKKLAVGLGAIVFMLLISSGTVNAQYIPTRADTLILNGIWSGNSSLADTADSAGELTVRLGAVVNGIPVDSLDSSDSLQVDTCFAFSSLGSLWVNDQTATNNDTVYFLYRFENWGNRYSDSFYVLVNVVDTSNTAHFVPRDFDMCYDTAGTYSGGADADSVIDGITADSAEVGLWLAQAALDSFYIRVVVPAPDSAADDDSILVAITVRDSVGSGGDDSWPTGRIVLDTSGTYLLASVFDDTLQDFGDTQYDTVKISIGAPTLRLKKITELAGSSTLPGDTVIYTVYYDNDGGSQTQDIAYIVDYLPYGVAFLDTVSHTPDTSNASGRNGNDAFTEGFDTEYLYDGTWLSHIPDASTIASRDSLWRITAIRWTVPAGIAPDGDGASSDDADDAVADDSLDEDAGYMKYRVRIR